VNELDFPARVAYKRTGIKQLFQWEVEGWERWQEWVAKGEMQELPAKCAADDFTSFDKQEHLEPRGSYNPELWQEILNCLIH
jgi:hypothetical protein